MVSLGPSSCVSLRWLSEEFPHVFVPAVRTWKYVFFHLWPCIWQSRVRCLGVVCGVRIGSSGDSALTRGATLGSTVETRSAQYGTRWDESHIFSTLPWTQILKCLVSVLTQNGKVCSADASVFSPARDARHLEIWKFFFIEFRVAGSCADGADFLGPQVPGCAGTPGVRLPGGPAHDAQFNRGDLWT